MRFLISRRIHLRVCRQKTAHVQSRLRSQSRLNMGDQTSANSRHQRDAACKKCGWARSIGMLIARSFCIAALIVLCGPLTAKLLAQDVPTAQLLETLLSADTSDAQWNRAASAFREVPTEAAIRALYPEIAKGIPGGWSYAKYNCSDPARDRHVAGWGRYCVANWLWCQSITCGQKRSDVGPILLELWAEPQSLYGRGVLLSTLDDFSWVPEAEEPVRELFADSQADSGLRAEAAACLLHHLGTKYQHDVIVFALFSSHGIRDFLFRQLVSPPYGRVSGVDGGVVRMGFWLMFEDLDENEERFARGGAAGSYYGAFLSGNALGTYLGEAFTPDRKLPKYQGEQGIELWYRETTENAVTWWLKNKERYAN